jgi:hypothetical protein
MTKTTLTLLVAGIGALGVATGLGLKGQAQTPADRALAAAAEPAAKKHIIDKILEEADPEVVKMLEKEKKAAVAADYQKLAKEKVDAAHQAVEARFKEFLAGRGTLDFLLESARRLQRAELAIATGQEQRLAAYEQLWKLTRAAEIINKARYDAGRIPVQDLADTTYARIEAQQKWVEARSFKEKNDKK